MKNRYCVWDLETTSVHSFKRFANQFDPRNKIIVTAQLIQGEDPTLLYCKEGLTKGTPPGLEDCNFLVGHNIKFDLLHVWGDPDFQQWVKDGGRIWDTMVAEYLLSGQESTYPSLDYCSEKYGGELKDDFIKECFEKGISADEIPEDKLLPYAEQDVINTEIVLLEQSKEAKRLGMTDVILAYMDHLMALCEMEFNGLHFDMEQAKELRTQYENDLEGIKVNLNKMIEPWWTLDEPYNPDSDEHNSAIFFGSPVTVVRDLKLVDEKTGEFLVYGPKAQKAGQIKTRKTKVEEKIPNMGVSMIFQKPLKKAGIFSTDKRVLSDIRKNYVAEGNERNDIVNFIDKLIEYRESQKILGTYLYALKITAAGKETETGLIPLVHPDGKIHHTLDCVQTKTGRVNSKNPNGQNIPRGLTQLFNSRFGDDGVIIAADFSQLEVCVQAYLTQSANMIKDIKNGVDFHCKRLAYAVDKPYSEVVKLCASSDEWKEKRKKAKVISFQKAYGAHPNKIADTTGLSVDVVTKVFDKEDAEYPEVKDYYEGVTEEVKRTVEVRPDLIKIRDRKRGAVLEKPGEYKHVGFYQSVTGKRYHFTELASWTKFDNLFRYFPSTDMYNFMVQGTASDIMCCQVAKLYRFLLTSRDKCVIVNEVHDEIVLDCRKDYLDEFIPQLKEILESVDESFQERFGMKFNVPISVDINYGKDWGEAK